MCARLIAKNGDKKGGCVAALLDPYLLAMEQRMSWTLGRAILHSADIPAGHGWDSTRKKLKKEKFTADQMESVRENCISHIICSDKAVTLIKSPASKRQALADALRAEITRDFSDRILKQFLDSAPSTAIYKPLLLAVEEREDALYAVYHSTRIKEIRKELNQSDFEDDQAKEVIGEFSEVVGIKRSLSRAFEVIVIPNATERDIEFRMDLSGAPVEQAAKCRLHIEQELEDRVPRFNEGYANLFPAIHRLYGDKKAGRVVDMSSVVPTGSTKSEKMRRKGTCLRDEPFHIGGVSAVDGKIEPYSIALAWKPKHSSMPQRELQIHGCIRDLHSANPSINYFIAKNCGEESQLHQMITLVRKYAATP